MKKKLLKAAVILAVGLVLYACSADLDNPVGPSTTPGTESLTTGGSGSPGGPGVVGTEPGDCDIIQLDRAGIKVETKCLTLRIFVPAGNADYVNLWWPELNYKLLKKCPVNEWCEYTFDEPGTYKIRLAVEKQKDSGGVYQCDRHKLEVTVDKCRKEEPKCPGDECPPPPCVVPELDGCYSGNIDTYQHLYDRFGICLARILRTGGEGSNCTTAQVSAALVVVKGGPGFNLYTNVTAGDMICTCDPDHNGRSPAISHIAYFHCDENAQCD